MARITVYLEDENSGGASRTFCAGARRNFIVHARDYCYVENLAGFFVSLMDEIAAIFLAAS
jgi:hypothetical protein